ncbi:MAG: 4Fe-4S binding protein [Planctomycetales bacterium]|nr:4Fe-4S binding protein [Planctomycetales bacterium]
MDPAVGKKQANRRTLAERIFLVVFLPLVVGFYTLYKYPQWLLPAGADPRAFYVGGKSPGFWYATVYTLVVMAGCLWVLLGNRNVYERSKKKGRLSRYQRGKFLSILASQTIAFYGVPFILLSLGQEGGFWNDPPKAAAKNAHVYVYPAFQSVGMAAYVFVVIPLGVWFFGKRYCSWFCSCGNLAEAVGVMPWGAKWVRMHTPRSPVAHRLEFIQSAALAFAMFFGVVLLADGARLFTATTLVAGLQGLQDLVIDFLFGSIVGVGAYPFLGTRIWCRYGCPLAKGMQIFGKYVGSRFAVAPNDKCRGLGLCTQACPMGIDVASFAHRDKQPIEVTFGLDSTPCIGCGGCIEVCPVDALAFINPRKGKCGN